MNSNIENYLTLENTNNFFFINRAIADDIIAQYNLNHIKEEDLSMIAENIDIPKSFSYIATVLNGYNEPETLIYSDGINTLNPSNNIFNLRYITHPNLIRSENKVIFVTDNFIDALSIETIRYSAIYISHQDCDLFKEYIDMNASNLTIYNVKIILSISNNSIKTSIVKSLTAAKIDFVDLNLQRIEDGTYIDINDYLAIDKTDLMIDLVRFVGNLFGTNIEANYKAETIPEDVIDNYEYINKLKILEEINVSDKPVTTSFKHMSYRERLKFAWDNPVDVSSLLRTGIKNFDDKVKYLENKIILIGAVPGMAKSSFVAEVAINMSLAKKHVIFFSLELEETFLVAKIFSSLSYNPEISDTIFDAEDIFVFMKEHVRIYNEHQYTQLDKIAEYYENNIEPYLHIDDFVDTLNQEIAPRSIESIKHHTDKFILKHQVRPVIIVDYIQQVEISDAKMSLLPDKQKLDYISKILITMRNKLGVTMFIVSSFNREAYNQVASKTSFKESGALEYSADLLFGIQWRHMYSRVQSKAKNADAYVSMLNKLSGVAGFKELEIVSCKGRTGGEGDNIYVNFDFKQNKFISVDNKCIIEPDLDKSIEDNIENLLKILKEESPNKPSVATAVSSKPKTTYVTI